MLYSSKENAILSGNTVSTASLKAKANPLCTIFPSEKLDANTYSGSIGPASSPL